MTTLVFDVLFSAEAADLEAKIAKAQAELDKLNAQKVNPKIDLDIDKAAAQVAQMKAKLDELSTKTSTPKVDADILAAKANLAIVQAKLDELNRQKISSTIDVDIAAAEAKVAALKAELDSISNKHVEVNVDTDKGVASVRALGSETDGLIAKFANVGPNFFSMGGAITTALIPGIQSVGALSGALGLIPAMAAGAGTAFATVALGVQGIDTAFKASEASIKANEAATKADAAAQTAHNQAVQAGAATGQANIAMLQQTVTQGAANLASLKAQGSATKEQQAAIAAATLTQQGHVAALKQAQAAYSGNASATTAYTSAQQNANTAASQAKSAHEAAAKAADAQAAAMKNLAPAAQGVVSALIQLKPSFDSLRMEVQQHLFEGLKQVLLDTANTALPVLHTGLDAMADSLNKGVKAVGDFIKQQSSISAWKDIFANLASAANNFMGAIKPILQIITDLVQVGSSFLPQMGTSFAQAAQAAADFVSHAKETGQLKEWIQTGIDAVKTLWGIFSDLVQIVAKVTEAPGPGLLDMVKGILDVVLQLITEFPQLITLVEAFIAAWVVAKVITAITGMITTIKTAATTIGLLTAAEKANAVAAAEAGAANEAAAVKAGAAWKAAGLLIAGAFLAVAADSVLPQAQAGDTSAFAHMRDELHQLAEAIKDPKKALDDLQGEFAHFGDNFPNFANSPFVQGFKDAWTALKTAASAGGSQVSAEAQKIQQAYRDAFTPLPAIVTGAMGGLNVVVNEGIHNIAAAVGQLSPQVQAQLGQLAPAMRGPAQAAMAGLLPIITSGIQNITNQVQGLSPQVQAALAPLSPAMQQSVQSAMGGMLPIVSSGIQNISQAVGQLPPQATASLTPLQAALETPATTGFAGMLTVVNQGVQNITQRTGQLPSDVQSSVGDLSSTLQPAGQSSMSGFYQSMIDFYNSTIAPWLAGIAASIANLKGPANEDYYILQDAGTAIMAGLHDSMQDRWSGIEDWLRSLRGRIGGAVGGATGGGSTPGLPGLPVDLGTGVASGLSGPLAPYITHPNYDFGALYNSLYPPPTPTPAPGGGGGGHGGHGHHGSGGFDLGQLQDAFRDALHDVFSGGIRTDVNYHALTLRLNQVARSNARR